MSTPTENQALIAFYPESASWLITTSGSVNTSVSTTITFTPAVDGIAYTPKVVRIVNTGTALVWVTFTPSATPVVAPIVGTPQTAIGIMPNSIELFTLAKGFTGGRTNPIFVNTISAVASQTLVLQFGEGQ